MFGQVVQLTRRNPILVALPMLMLGGLVALMITNPATRGWATIVLICVAIYFALSILAALYFGRMIRLREKQVPVDSPLRQQPSQQ